MKFDIFNEICSFQKHIWPICFFLSVVVDVKGWKLSSKVEDAEHILSKISEIIEDTIFV